ncbi:MAG: hypothetical protein QQN63_12735 [Nitrosopumilus sp.]
MIIYTMGYDTDLQQDRPRVTYTWTLDNEWKPPQHPTRVCELTASDAEMEIIHDCFRKSIPMANVKCNIWRGDMATYIVDNLGTYINESMID